MAARPSNFQKYSRKERSESFRPNFSDPTKAALAVADIGGGGGDGGDGRKPPLPPGCRRGRQLAVAVIGGDGRKGLEPGLGKRTTVRIFASSRQSGNGSMRSAREAITNHSFDLVVLLSRWLGHSEFYMIVDGCRAAGVPYRIVSGGYSAAKRSIQQFLEQEAHSAR